jgi:formate dehydrogenase iron-sulfur subunit
MRTHSPSNPENSRAALLMEPVPPGKALLLSDTRTLIDDLLRDQQQLTAVERFTRLHAEPSFPAQSQYYRSLLPSSSPGAGRQYAFEVDLDKCTGCKACVTACHSLNGLEETESWRGVGLLLSRSKTDPAIQAHSSPSASFPATFAAQQHVTAACHHCVDPACLNGCPVLAYEKDPVTGIVRHLDDQCIGCQYCILKCPYDAPKFSKRLGIVRKCDLCAHRLADDEAPACVQACPNEAIRITLVDAATVTREFRETGKRFLTGAPAGDYTLPTTRYLSRNSNSSPISLSLIPADADAMRLEPPHLPLVWMLVLTQLACGAHLFLPFAPAPARFLLAAAALAAVGAGLSASLLHLGRPLKAWRCFLNLRHSWLSREVAALGTFANLSAITFGALWIFPSDSALLSILMPFTAITGLAGVFCSGMVYHDTHRPFWKGELSVGKFFGATLILGLAAAWVATALAGVTAPLLPILLAVVTFLKLARELNLLLPSRPKSPSSPEPNSNSPDQSARILRCKLGKLCCARFLLGGLGGILIPTLSLMLNGPAPIVALSALILSLSGEWIERYTFFRAVVPLKMPGAVSQ